MIRVAHRPGPTARPAWHAGFLALLPAIARHAGIAFRHLDAEAREEAVQECLVNALVAYGRLVQLGKVDLAYPMVLARYAVAQFHAGRRIACRLSVRDVMSPAARKQRGIRLERLDRYDRDEEFWLEAVVEDHRTPVAEQAAFRIDFPDWLGGLSCRHRRAAELLAVSHTTREVAQRCKVSDGRVSQMRRELHCSWQRFHGEEVAAESAAVPAA